MTHRWRRPVWLLAAAGLILLGFYTLQRMNNPNLRDEARKMVETCIIIRNELRPWEQARHAEPSEAEVRYAGHFDLPNEGVTHRLGAIQFNGRPIAVQQFVPDGVPRGTVVLLHGYLDHSAVNSRAIEEFVDWGFTVVAYDMPGHGLSGGTPADIDNFTDYAEILLAVLHTVCADSAKPLHLVAHSTGAVAVLGALHQSRDEPIPDLGEVILLAPLVHSWGERFSAVGHALARPFVKRVPRIQRRVSHDEHFSRMLRHGNPLRIQLVPLHWFGELRKWQRKVRDWPPLPEIGATVLQGTEDNVVAWQKNLSALRTLLPAAQIHTIDGAYHHLLNEDRTHRKPVYQILRKTLLKSATKPEKSK